ncbi:MAG: peptidylprolyl isomerase [Isosphaeraceae bacterium]
MLDRALGGVFRWGRGNRSKPSRARTAQRPVLEGLEGRELMIASIAGISPVTVPQSLGFQVPLNGSAAGGSQTFTVTSSNPDIKATVAQGKFLTLNLTHTAASGQAGDVSFTGTVTFQLFEDLTPMTASKIESFVTSGYYSNKTIHRVAGNFTNQNLPFDYVIQGGAPNPDGTGSSGLPGTPFGLEINQQLAYVNTGSLAMARSSSPNSNDVQFFWTTGTPTTLNQQYTIFGQVVAGYDTIQKITQVATTTNSGLGNEKSLPISPITITSATLSDTNPNGVIHIDATGAVQGETATIRVTARDASDNTTAVQTFNVTVGADKTTHSNFNGFTFKPLAFPVTQNVQTGTSASVQLNGTTQNPGNTAVKVSYALVTQPQHGTITNFNAQTGALTYTPAAGFTGTDTFRYTVSNTGGTPSPLAGNTQTVTLNVQKAVVPTEVDTGAVRVVNHVLLITPRPRTDGGTNVVIVNQANGTTAAGNKLVVQINGSYDRIQPLVSSLDRVVVYGAKANDNVVILPTVDSRLRVTLDGGRGNGANILQAGSGTTRLHGWSGHNVLIGGAGTNHLVGKKGHVRFRPNGSTSTIYIADPSKKDGGGTFYHYSNGKLVEGVAPTTAAKSTARAQNAAKVAPKSR